MPPIPQDPQQLHGGLPVSREDFELLHRVLRVVRHLQAQDIPLDPLLGLQQPQFGGNISPNHDNRISSPTPRRSGNGNQSTIEISFDSQQDDDEDDEDDYDVDEEEDVRVGEQRLANARAASYQETDPRRHLRDAQTSTSTHTSTRSSTLQQRQEHQQHYRSSSQQQQQQQQQQQPQQPQQPQRAHAAVEKRYRSVLNSKIQELSALIPASNTFSLSNEPGVQSQPENTPSADQVKQQTKSVILDRAIQYIHHLVSTYEQYEAEEKALRGKLQLWLDDTSLLVSDQTDLTHT